MTVTETLGGLGSWELRLDDAIPDAVYSQIGFYGHVAIVPGPVDVEAAGDGLLAGARYVGVCRAKGKPANRRIAGSGMVFWLGDEDNKGHVIETEVVLTAQTFTQAVTALLPPTVSLGTIYSGATGTYTGKHLFQTPRQALTTVCDAFTRELRVNGNATVDFGTQAQLYKGTPDTILKRKGAGSDIDLTGLAGEFDVDQNVYDKSTRVVLIGQTVGLGDAPDEIFAIGSGSAPSVTDVDLRGNPLKMTRIISESGETEGSIPARVQLHLNRFNRVTRSLQLRLDDYEIEGAFRVGDNVYVFDPDTDIVDPAVEVDFRGEKLNPDAVRVSGMTWPVTRGMTVAFRTQAGVWIDLTPFVTFETDGTEITIGDLPKSLTRPGDDPIQLRVDGGRGSSPDSSIPKAPTGLQLVSDSTLNPQGQNVAGITASWTAVTQNTDDSVITDLSHYLVAFRPQFRAPQWEPARIATVNSIDLSGLVVDLDYDVRVAAVDTANHVSAWSSTASIRAAKDSTAPPAPADPVATQVMGASRVEYVGTSSLGAAMPSDTNRVDLHIGTTSGFTPTTATRVISFDPFAKGVYYATVPYGAAARWAKLIAVDHTGNASSPSAAAALTASQVVSPDVFDGAIGTAKLADLAVTNAKIGLLAVNDANIGSLNVGKLVSGTGTFELILAGTIQTAATGQRTGLNALGFFGYDAAGAKTIDLNGDSNLLTGIFKTALTGRRIEIGAGAAVGELNMYAPDGKRSFVRSLTESAGVEAIQLGIEVAGASNLWNRINYNASANGEYATYRSGTHEFVYDTSAPNTAGRFMVFQNSLRGTGTGTLRLDINSLYSILRGPFVGSAVGSEFHANPTSLELRVGDPNTQGRMEIGQTFWRYWHMDGTTQRLRWQLDDASLSYWDGNGTQRIQIADTAATSFVLRGADGVTDLEMDDTSFRFNPSLSTGDKTGQRIEIRRNDLYSQSPRIFFQTNRVTAADGAVYQGILKMSVGRFEFRNGNDTAWVNTMAGRIDANGDIVATGGVYGEGFKLSSDASLKNGIRTLEVGALAKIKATRATRYKRNSRPDGAEELGLIGQELQKVAPEIVFTDEDGILGVDLYGMATVEWSAIQELLTRVEALEATH